MIVTNRDRSTVAPADTWKVDDLYPSLKAFEGDLGRLETEVTAFAATEASLDDSPEKLADCLGKLYTIERRMARLIEYANRLHDQDASDVRGQELHDRTGKLETRVRTTMAFVRPAILAIPAKRLKGWIENKALRPYQHALDDITRLRGHIRKKSEEEIIARTGDLAGVPENVYEVLSTLNLPFPEVTLRDGQRVTLTQAMYTRYRAAPEREDRIKVFQAFWSMYRHFRESFASLLSGVVSRNRLVAQVRQYPDELASALDSTNVPIEVYHTMIREVRRGLPLLWRSLKLRKRFLGLAELGYHDLYASLAPGAELRYDWQAARAILPVALKPLGPEYLEIVRRAFDDRWTDVYPTRGKRSGAYMAGGAYDVHPYVLLNYNDDYDSLSTTAHEFGHAAHSFLSNKHQPYHDAHYPIFAAEVASTANEELLRLHLTTQEQDRARKLFMLGEYLEGWRQTVFRQCLFAEFELRIHALARQGEALTADLLDRVYLELLREYYGEDEGIVRIDPLYATEWAFIPHFYLNFYMFQYTTSFIASSAIARPIFDGDTKARDQYLAMLRAGGSRYPLELLRMAGVDLATADPYQKALSVFAQAIQEAEQLVP